MRGAHSIAKMEEVFPQAFSTAVYLPFRLPCPLRVCKHESLAAAWLLNILQVP